MYWYLRTMFTAELVRHFFVSNDMPCSKQKRVVQTFILIDIPFWYKKGDGYQLYCPRY